MLFCFVFSLIRKPKKNLENAVVWHTKDCHMEEKGEVQYKMEVVKCYSRAMNCQIGEGCYMQSPEAIFL